MNQGATLPGPPELEQEAATAVSSPSLEKSCELADQRVTSILSSPFWGPEAVFQPSSWVRSPVAATRPPSTPSQRVTSTSRRTVCPQGAAWGTGTYSMSPAGCGERSQALVARRTRIELKSSRSELLLDTRTWHRSGLHPGLPAHHQPAWISTQEGDSPEAAPPSTANTAKWTRRRLGEFAA